MRRVAALTALVSLVGCAGQSPMAPTTASSPPPPPSVAQIPPLVEASRMTERWVGTAVQTSLLGNSVYAETFARHFDYVTAEWEMKWDPIQRQPDVFDFSRGDQIVAFAESRGIRVKGHALLWHSALPSWVEELSPPELQIAIDAHIREVAGHYAGRVVAWDVVNEAVADQGGVLRSSVFLQKLGPDYIANAFRTAREADPQALLFYNDYNTEALTTKANRAFELVRDLVNQGVPIDGVGLQMHVTASAPPNLEDIAANMRRLGELGLLVNISEMDVRISSLSGDAASRLETQRRIYKDIVAVCVAEPACHAVTFWGFTDAHSWIDEFFGPDDPLLFDAQYQPKPAFFGVEDAFLRR